MITGNFDGVSSDGNSFMGWAVDQSQPSVSISINLIIDGTTFSNIPTDQLRPDVNTALGITGNHGFLFTIPAQYRNGQSYVISCNANGTTIAHNGNQTFTYQDASAFWDFSQVTVPPPRSDLHDLIAFVLTSKTYNIGDDPWGTPGAIWTYSGNQPLYLRKIVHGVGSAIDVLCDVYAQTQRNSDEAWISLYWRDRYQNPSGPGHVLQSTELNPYMIIEPGNGITVNHESQVIAVLNNQQSRVIDHIIVCYANYAP